MYMVRHSAMSSNVFANSDVMLRSRASAVDRSPGLERSVSSTLSPLKHPGTSRSIWLFGHRSFSSSFLLP